MSSHSGSPSPHEGELVAVIERTHAVAERWKAMHLREESLCAEQRRRAKQSARAVSSAREMRDSAIEAQRAAQDEVALAKHEKARWRARADAQTNAKVYLEAERLRGTFHSALRSALRSTLHGAVLHPGARSVSRPSRHSPSPDIPAMSRPSPHARAQAPRPSPALGELLAREGEVAQLQQALVTARREQRPEPGERTPLEAGLQAEVLSARQMQAAAEGRCAASFHPLSILHARLGATGSAAYSVCLHTVCPQPM